MTESTIISTYDLNNHLADPNWVILDCRCYYPDMQRGETEYLQTHIPGAVYVHLERDLSAPLVPGVTGRHPLPDIATAAETFSSLGISDGVQVVAYDDAGGALAAARAWWMLRWLGHTSVAVLNGGWGWWVKEGRLVRAGRETNPRREFHPRPRPELLVDATQVAQMRLDPAYHVFDSRAAERYRGENETLDPIAGHIPGAVSAPFAVNLQPEGRFRPKANLRNRFRRLAGDLPADKIVFYCGSGVTAAHNLLAMEYAGLGEAKLYAGSWSEWITDPKRPVEK